MPRGNSPGLQQPQQLAAHGVHTCVGKTEVHFLIAPETAGDAVPLEDRVQVAEPFDGLGGRHDVDHAVFAAVERAALLLRFFQSRGQEILKIRLTRAALVVGKARRKSAR